MDLFQTRLCFQPGQSSHIPNPKLHALTPTTYPCCPKAGLQFTRTNPSYHEPNHSEARSFLDEKYTFTWSEATRFEGNSFLGPLTEESRWRTIQQWGIRLRRYEWQRWGAKWLHSRFLSLPSEYQCKHYGQLESSADGQTEARRR